LFTEDGWVEERWFDLGSSVAHYSEDYDDNDERKSNPIGFGKEDEWVKDI
jgi:hypothetical protein